jgi:transcriptional regulator
VYLPPAFREDRIEILHGLIREIVFATLVSATPEGGVEVTHLPFLLDPEPAPLGTLLGHLARANGHVTALRRAREAVAIFLGPEAYVSPSLYPSKREHGRVVPTWNYVAVHATGTPELIEEPAALLRLVERLTDEMERTRAEPWAVDDAPAPFIAGQLKGIVGVRLHLARLEGKLKLSQNRPTADRAAVLAALESSPRPGDRAVADRMAAKHRLAPPETPRGLG